MDRVLHWDGCVNVRELGGLVTMSGTMVRRGALVRADSPHALTSDGMAALRAYGVSRVLDLRTADQAAHLPGPFVDDPIYHHLSMIDPVAELGYEHGTDADLASVYRGSLSRNVKHIVAAVAAIEQAPAGVVVLHCHAGKDRTGMVVALVLAALRVPADAIVADYAYSSVALAGRLRHMLDAAEDDAERRSIRAWRDAHPETMAAMLAHLDQVHGGAERYLLDNGMSAGQLSRLRARLLTSIATLVDAGLRSASTRGGRR